MTSQVKISRAAISPAVMAVTVIVAVIIAGGGAYYVGRSMVAGATTSTSYVTETQTVNGGTQTSVVTVTGPTETTTQSTTYLTTTTNTVTNPILLAAPVQTSPANGSTFSNYPRTTVVTWDAVSGAAYYIVQVDYYSPGVTNCTGGSIDDMNVTTSTTYTFSFVGAQPGCWTVSAVAADGQAGLASPWWLFTYTV